jgi:hypothetical protein
MIWSRRLRQAHADLAAVLADNDDLRAALDTSQRQSRAAQADARRAGRLLQDQMGHVLDIRAQNTTLIEALRRITSAEAEAHRAFSAQTDADATVILAACKHDGYEPWDEQDEIRRNDR